MTDLLKCPDCGIPTIPDRPGLMYEETRCNACDDRAEKEDNEFMGIIVGAMDRAKAEGRNQDEEVDRSLRAAGFTVTSIFEENPKW